MIRAEQGRDVADVARLAPPGVAAVPGRRSGSSLYARERWHSGFFLLPAISILLVTSVYPLGYSLSLSLFAWNMSIPNSRPVFVGLDNYAQLLKDPAFLSSLQVTFLFVTIAVAVELVLGLALALLVTSRLRGLAVIRVGLLIPMMMTPVVAGVLWRTLFHSAYGVVNPVLGVFGLPPREWLGDVDNALPAVIAVEIWQHAPVVIFVLAAGIQSLPRDAFEAAKVDGASRWQTFRFVTLPLLRPIIAVVLMLRIMDAFKVFDIIYSMTAGGPGGATEVLSLLIYKVGLKFFQMGQASAMSWVYLLFILALTYVFLRQLQRREAI